MVPLGFMEDDMTWVESNLSGDAWVMRDEAIELYNWLICFICALEEFNVVVTKLSDWMGNSYPPWSTYHELMACSQVALDKMPVVSPIGIWETKISMSNNLEVTEDNIRVKIVSNLG